MENKGNEINKVEWSKRRLIETGQEIENTVWIRDYVL